MCSSIQAISNGEVMFISDRKIFDVICSGSVYGLVVGELSSWIVQFVNEGVCVVALSITIKVGEGEKQTSIDAELFNSVSSSGWQILILLEAVQTTGTIFDRKASMLHLTLK